MKYKVRQGDRDAGEWTLEEIKGMYYRGQLGSQDRIWMNDRWLRLSEIVSRRGHSRRRSKHRKYRHHSESGGKRSSHGSGHGGKPDNNLIFAILVTVFCCVPFGVVSIVYATKVNPAYDSGDHELAREHARASRMWMMLGVLCGIIAGVFSALFTLTSGAFR